ncbi:MAG: AMP-binding protein [Treponema sp.]
MQTLEALGKYTFQHLLENSVKLFEKRPAVSFADDVPITYSEFYKRVKQTQKLLTNLGLHSGDHIAILSPSSPFWGITYFAIVLMGCVAVPLLHDFTENEIASCLKHSNSKALFVSKKMQSKIQNMEDLGIIINIEDSSLLKGSVLNNDEPQNYLCNEEDLASIIYTSGTTGRSKGVMLTHKNLVFTAITSQQAQRINCFDVAVSILPMSHVYEFTIGFLMFILNGACIYYLEGPPVPRTLLPVLAKVRPQFMLVVPLVIEKIYKQKVLPSFTKGGLITKLYHNSLARKMLCRIAGKKLIKTFGGRLKFFGIGGAKIDPVVEEFMKDAGFPYAIGYGLTETSPLVAYSSVGKTKPGYLGHQLSGIEVKIDQPDPETGVGELVVKGDNVMKGYYNEPTLTKEAFTEDGFFKTGDLCMIDKKGWIRLMGRSKNMILGASGENIYPEDIEFVINQHPLVSESLVIEGENSSLLAYVKLDEEKLNATAMNEVNGEKTFSENLQGMASELSDAFMYKKEELLNEIKFFINTNVNRMSRIDTIKAVSEFEKTASQKIKRYLYSIQSNKKEEKKED